MTELFLKLLGANVENGVDIAKASLALRGGFSIGAYVVLVLVFGAIVYWMYRKSPAHLTPFRKYTLAALRTLFLGLLLMLLLRPVLAFTVEGSVRRLLVLLMDTSSSMQIKDPRLAWIELDYALKVAPSNPLEAKRVFAELRDRTTPQSPIYPRVKALEKTME